MSSNLSIHGVSGVPSIVPDVPAVEYKAAKVSSDIQPLKDHLVKLEGKNEAISIGDEQLIRSIERAIKAIEGKATALEFSVHDKTKQIMVKVLNKDTGEVIREIPPEKTMDFVAKLWEMAGILVDEKR